MKSFNKEGFFNLNGPEVGQLVSEMEQRGLHTCHHMV